MTKLTLDPSSKTTKHFPLAGRIASFLLFACASLHAGETQTQNQTAPGCELTARRAALEEKGITFAGSYIGEGWGNSSGGVKRDATYTGLLQLNLDLDFQKLFDWNGATFHVSGIYPMGKNPSLYSGDLMGVSSIAAYNTPHLYELWFEQKLFNERFSLRLGQLAVDSEFALSDAAGNFIRPSFCALTYLACTVPTPQYPYAAPGVRWKVDPNEAFTYQGGIYASNPAPGRLGDPHPTRPSGAKNNSGVEFGIAKDGGLFTIHELQYKRGAELPGTYKLGVWYSSDTFSYKTRFDADGNPRAAHGNYGVYGVFDQTVWKKDAQAVNLFFRGGSFQGDRSVFDYYLDGGATFTGLLPGRSEDVFGVAAAYGDISHGLLGNVAGEFVGPTQPRPDYEAAIEVTYKAQIRSWLSIQPDLQYIFHPGGSSGTPNALVLGCRMAITF